MSSKNILSAALLLTMPFLAVATAPSAVADFPGWDDYECHIPFGNGCPGGTGATAAVVPAGERMSIHYHGASTTFYFVELADAVTGATENAGCPDAVPSGRSTGMTYTTYTFTPGIYRLTWSNAAGSCGAAMGAGTMDERLIIVPTVFTIQPIDLPDPCLRKLNGGDAFDIDRASSPYTSGPGQRECIGGDPWDRDCNGHSSEWGSDGSGSRRYETVCTGRDPHVCSGEGETWQEKEYDQQSETYSSSTAGRYEETCGGDGGDCYGVWNESGRLEEDDYGRVHKVPGNRDWVAQVCPTVDG